MENQPVYSIGVLARMLDIPAATLRTWEDRYAIVVPERSPAGHRLYSPLQVEQLRFVGDRVSTGLSPGDAYRLLQQRLVSGVPLNGAQIPDRSGSLILLVERDPYAADFSEYFLRQAGHDVAVATTVEQAIAETMRNTPDLAVVDLLISGGDGLRLCVRLREQLDIPVLAISTFAIGDDALAAGAAAFLLKPLKPPGLISVVQDLLRPSALLAKSDQ